MLLVFVSQPKIAICVFFIFVTAWRTLCVVLSFITLCVYLYLPCLCFLFSCVVLCLVLCLNLLYCDAWVRGLMHSYMSYLPYIRAFIWLYVSKGGDKFVCTTCDLLIWCVLHGMWVWDCTIFWLPDLHSLKGMVA